MLLLIILTWTVGIPVAVLAVATTFAWWRDRRERRFSLEPGGSARIYQFIPPSRRTA